MRITEKRALLLREWLLAVHGNNQDYYYSTLFMGIPDGDDYETVKGDLEIGFYDDNIDGMVEIYTHRRRIYNSDGWYVEGVVYNNESDAVTAIESYMGIRLPSKIYKRTAL